MSQKITLFMSRDKAVTLLAVLSELLRIVHEAIVEGNFEDSELVRIFGNLDSIHTDLLCCLIGVKPIEIEKDSAGKVIKCLIK